jgi:Arc/MetJ-type ribon-helix-helix transcriptional regulator
VRITIDIDDEVAAFVTRCLESGAYQSESDVIEVALILMRRYAEEVAQEIGEHDPV